jgi:hypothetical protein
VSINVLVEGIIFVSEDFLQCENLMYDRETAVLVHCFLSWRRRFLRSWTSGVVLMMLVLFLQELIAFLATAHNAARALHCV